MIFPLCRGTARLLPVHTDNPCYLQLKECAEHIIFCAKENRAQTDLLMKGELLKLLWYTEQSGSVICRQETDSWEEIRTVLDYMAEHYEDAITIELLARQVHLSESYFMQRFREISGMGAIEYLNRLRIQKACEKILGVQQLRMPPTSADLRIYPILTGNLKLLQGVRPDNIKSKSEDSV